MPPRIGPFNFRENAAAGIRVQVTCGLEQGDLPVSISWLKDGEALSPDHQSAMDLRRPGLLGRLGVDVRFLDAYSSLLVIPHLTAAHAGNYTCQATNAARSVTYTAPLTVSGNVAPPTSRVAPTRPHPHRHPPVVPLAPTAWCRRGSDAAAAALHRSSCLSSTGRHPPTVHCTPHTTSSRRAAHPPSLAQFYNRTSTEIRDTSRLKYPPKF